MAVPSVDGRTVFVSLDSDNAQHNGIGVLQRTATGFSLTSVIPMTGTPLGLALTPDGQTLVVANGEGVAALSARTAASGAISPVSYLRQTGTPGTIEVAISPDGGLVFFSNERSASIGVARLGSVSGTAVPGWSFVGFVPADLAPVGLELSSDGQWLYAVSQIALSHKLRDRHGGNHPRVVASIDADAGFACADVNGSETT